MTLLVTLKYRLNFDDEEYDEKQLSTNLFYGRKPNQN